MNVTTIGIDLAKTVFSIHGTDQYGKVVVRKQLSRKKRADYLGHFDGKNGVPSENLLIKIDQSRAATPTRRVLQRHR